MKIARLSWCFLPFWRHSSHSHKIFSLNSCRTFQYNRVSFLSAGNSIEDVLEDESLFQPVPPSFENQSNVEDFSSEKEILKPKQSGWDIFLNTNNETLPSPTHVKKNCNQSSNKKDSKQKKKIKKVCPQKIEIILDENDIEEKFARGSGKGGQKINKNKSKVQLHHIPTGIQVDCQEFRELTTNRKRARTILKEKLDVFYNGDLSKRGKRIAKIQRRKERRTRKYNMKSKLAIGTNNSLTALSSDSQEQEKEYQELNISILDSEEDDEEDEDEDEDGDDDISDMSDDEYDDDDDDDDDLDGYSSVSEDEIENENETEDEKEDVENKSKNSND